MDDAVVDAVAHTAPGAGLDLLALAPRALYVRTGYSPDRSLRVSRTAATVDTSHTNT